MSINKLFVMLFALGFVFLLSAFNAKQEEYKAQNLKVLPKNSTKEEIDTVMDNFKIALGVKCSYCHAPSKLDPKKMDFASDDNPKKNIARKMMKMTAKIEKKYFDDHLVDGKNIANLSCNTCHNGKSKPTI